jgi:phosphate transport system permease protein
LSFDLNSRLKKQRIVFSLISILAVTVLLSMVAILIVIFVKGMKVINWNFLTSLPSFDFYGVPHGGIGPAIVGTLYVTALGLLFSVPLGVLGGIFLSEYKTKGKVFNLMRISVANLAGVPSVVHGLFGMAVFTVFLGFGLSVLSASLTLSILALPIIMMTTENAMKDVPDNIREGAFALGAKKWQNALLIVFPAAFSKIITGVILASARISGETAPILFTGATLYLTFYPNKLNEQFMALPYMIWGLVTTSINISASTPFAYGVAIVLVTLVGVINAVAMMIRFKSRKKSAT